jgi:hypothetical protein
MLVSPPIRFRIEWADSQGKVTASWLAAHFSFPLFAFSRQRYALDDCLTIPIWLAIFAFSLPKIDAPMTKV